MSNDQVAGSKRISAIRLVARKFVGTAFSGDGARLYGGRWNSIGTSMVYAAGSVSLAILEWRVHLAQWPAPAVAVIGVEIQESHIWIPPKPPRGWKRRRAAMATAAFGDEWIKTARSAALRVPSVVAPGEWNYLLNPAHPDFPKVVIGKPRLLKTDVRWGPIAEA